MPFQSKAQIRKFGELVKQGKMSQGKMDEWMTATKNPKALPERKSPKPSGPNRIEDLRQIYKRKFGR